MALPPFRKLNSGADELFSRAQDNVSEPLRALASKSLLVNGESALFLEATVTVPDDWLTPTIGSDWQQYVSASYSNVGYRKDAAGMVYVRGVVQSIGASIVILSALPAAYRPAGNHIFPTYASGAFGSVAATSAGNVEYVSGSLASDFHLFSMAWKASASAPVPLSCWPIQIPCALKTRPNAVFLAEARETAANAYVCAANPDWDWDTQQGQNFVIINNVPFLPAATYDLTFAVLGVT